ncbi:hypothetical protein Hbl1158_01205 [Halobaculum sp. CBA1158]|uniref:hypothetical protein n=1 Tax=Halobaculum sp. CBA1158 TaxID=2904243 RepID=UPI001F34A40E|nr:hypothetical protein [Halobaculum sp. CBA1158]UIP00019.1 hypothetical protein Hbl1158_01205 [Halobaculum sp. CBA1158]
MDRTFLASIAVTALSVVGYLAGTVTAYPGREAALAGMMIGVTLAAVTYGRSRTATDAGSEPTGGTEP